MKKHTIKTLIIEGLNGFSRRQKHNPKDGLPLIIRIPFMYHIKLTDPILGLNNMFSPTAIGEFHLFKKTKTTAFYTLENFKFIETK